MEIKKKSFKQPSFVVTWKNKKTWSGYRMLKKVMKCLSLFFLISGSVAIAYEVKEMQSATVQVTQSDGQDRAAQADDRNQAAQGIIKITLPNLTIRIKQHWQMTRIKQRKRKSRSRHPI